MTQHILYVIL